MYQGVPEQIGTPMEVFEKPASTFVAGFIGSPPMNLMEVNVAGDGTVQTIDGLALEISPLQVPSQVPASYTHLDVYKRQLQDLPDRRQEAPRQQGWRAQIRMRSPDLHAGARRDRPQHHAFGLIRRHAPGVHQGLSLIHI